MPFALATVLALSIGGVTVVSTAAQADDVPPPAPADVSSAPDEATAARIAVAQGHEVRVDAETTPTTTVSAQPDGTLQYEANTLPVRTQREGEWVAIDEALTADDSGMLAPKAAEVPVRFSSGGSNVLDQVQTDSG